MLSMTGWGECFSGLGRRSIIIFVWSVWFVVNEFRIWNECPLFTVFIGDREEDEEKRHEAHEVDP